MKSLLNHWVRLCGLLVLLQSGIAQEISFHITPLHEQGAFRSPDLVELVKLDPAIKLDIRYATIANSKLADMA
jgi:D-alanyl-D-alanine dipeptidase